MINMRIGIDARDVLRKPSGIAVYTTSLIQGLARQDRENEYLLYLDNHYDPAVEHSNIVRQNNFCWKVLKASPSLWKQISLPYNLKLDRVDLFHSTTSTLPLVRPCRTVVTFCDLFHEINPEWVPPNVRTRLHRLYKFAAQHATLVIAISENTKRDLMKIYGIKEQKIKVIYPGKSDLFRPVKDVTLIEELRRRLKIRDRFLLHVGALAYWRNISNLLKAFAILKKQKVPHQLVLVGRSFWSFDLNRLLAELDLEGEVINLGYLSTDELVLLYNGAEALVFPSLYEGFGIPVLEAMSCRTPVVASCVASLPEVVGEAALLIDPYDVESIADGMARVIRDKSLYRELVEKGMKRAKLFSWDKMAQQVGQAYKEAVSC